MPYFVYILKSLKEESYYVDSTQDLKPRLERHNQGQSKYTKAKRPWQLIYFEEYTKRSVATRQEREIKSHKSREWIEDLVIPAIFQTLL
jgi:putative endonuclease